jgi:CRP-like cAMP-binding protein
MGFTMSNVVLEDLPLFLGISPQQLDLIRPLFVPSDCHPGTVLFEQGDPAIFLYLVVSGEVAIRYKPEDGQDLTVARVRAGGLVGWSAVIGRREYTSGAICTHYSNLLRLRGCDLQILCDERPETGYLILNRLANVVAQRQGGTQHPVMALLENNLRNGCHKEANGNGNCDQRT